jgi:hypothetical protein
MAEEEVVDLPWDVCGARASISTYQVADLPTGSLKRPSNFPTESLIRM